MVVCIYNIIFAILITTNNRNKVKAFIKNNIKESSKDKYFYIEKFKSLGFEVKSVQISYANGCSAYISLSVKVINENKMYADVFVYNGQADITVRISDHQSNLERICGGVAGNRLSYIAFISLVENKIIIQ